ncbi:MAG TPA: DNA-binding transcriptional regulator [Opitutaceae bacterium]|nr:DNA-binding transcriptional regulator [Opitutaceae bacterium]
MEINSATSDAAFARAPSSKMGAAQPRVLLVFDTRLEEAAAMLRGIAEYEREHGAWTVFFDDMAHAESDPDWLLGNHWDGVISRHTTPMLAQVCVERTIPLVDLNDSPAFAGIAKIRPANPGIGKLGAEHLLNAGFRSFAFSGFSNEGWARERRLGFVEALAPTGFPCVVHEVEYPGTLTPDWDRQQQALLAEWLRRLPGATAVMACNDMRALQVLAAANTLMLSIPDELAVLGANNDVVRCELAQPSLSSVATNPTQAGRKAAELLAQLMAGSRDGAPADIRIEPAGVVSRRSTDVLAVTDKVVAAAIAYIRAHACEGINVDQVLQHVAMSRAQIEKKFRQHLGRSPQAEIRRVQIQRIKQLLIETDLPLKRIAEMTGFDYMEYMSAVFKRTTGLTPGACRRLFRGGGAAVAVPAA